jgi:hypothetical protein
MRTTLVVLIALAVLGLVRSEIGDGDSHTIDTEKGEVDVELDAEPDAVYRQHINKEFPEICQKVETIWGPLLNAKADANLELKLFHTAGVLAQDLEAKMEQHKKKDHNHFDCHEAKGLLSMTSARETLDLFRTLLHVPLQGHTGESVESTIRDMQQSLQAAKLISYDAYTEFEEVLKNLKKLHGQYDVIKKDYDAVMTEHADCKVNFQNFIKETLDLTHDDIPKWEQLQFGVDSLREQCARPEEL